MDIGQLRHIATVLIESTSQDEVGQLVATWTTFASIRCRILHMTNRAQEGPKAGAIMATHRVQFRTRYRLDLTPAMRILHRTKLYRIIGVMPNEMNMEWTDIDCELIE